MIDLHIQTMQGEGDMSVYRLLETINENDIEYFSILDNNQAFAYRLIDKKEFPKLITGVKLKTSFNGRIIDLIGYDIDVDLINEWYEETYPIEKVELIEKETARRLLKILSDKGYELSGIELRYDRLGQVINDIFKELIEEYPLFEYTNARDFKVYEVNNPKSDYYVDRCSDFLSIDEAIEVIRQNGGKVFLAHPFEYRSDVSELLELVLSKKLDGVEVFHSSASLLNSLKLLEFCEVTKKLASIGTGFVGNSELIPLGVHVDEDILSKDCFKWIFER